MHEFHLIFYSSVKVTKPTSGNTKVGDARLGQCHTLAWEGKEEI